MVKAYDGKLAEFVIPVEELGFDPLVPAINEWIDIYSSYLILSIIQDNFYSYLFYS